MDDASDTSEDLTLRPLVADILRTRYCVPDSLFLLEGLEHLQPTRSTKWRAVRLVLGDGALCIQGLLTLDMHRYVDSGELVPGCLVRLHVFELCSESVEGGGKMVYLCVEDFTVVGWCEEFAALHALERPAPFESSPPSVESDGGAERGYEGDGGAEETAAINNLPEPEHETPNSDSNDDRLDFEPSKPATPPRPSIPAFDDFDEDDFPSSIPESPTQLPQPLPPPVALSRNWTSPHHPLKLTTLSAIPHLPYRQNWSINTLAVLASLSEVQPSPFPPHTQRVARLADPSTPKRVQLTVFLDAQAFVPRVGSVVLLAGVKNHLFDGGSLKKYASDRPREGMPWWVEGPTFAWCRERVGELGEWWVREGNREEDH